LSPRPWAVALAKPWQIRRDGSVRPDAAKVRQIPTERSAVQLDVPQGDPNGLRNLYFDLFFLKAQCILSLKHATGLVVDKTRRQRHDGGSKDKQARRRRLPVPGPLPVRALKRPLIYKTQRPPPRGRHALLLIIITTVFVLISSHLISSHLISSHLISSHLAPALLFSHPPSSPLCYAARHGASAFIPFPALTILRPELEATILLLLYGCVWCPSLTVSTSFRPVSRVNCQPHSDPPHDEAQSLSRGRQAYLLILGPPPRGCIACGRRLGLRSCREIAL